MSSQSVGSSARDESNTDHIIVTLRTVHQNQSRLNVLADQKANINIGFTLLFITLSQSQLIYEQGAAAGVRFGFVALIVSIVASLLLALAVVFPRTGHTRVREAGQMSNPFFFGLFSQLEQDVYVEYLLDRLDDDRTAHRLLLIDIYQIGGVLRRKYRLLRLSYSFLALGAFIAVVLFSHKALAG